MYGEGMRGVCVGCSLADALLFHLKLKSGWDIYSTLGYRDEREYKLCFVFILQQENRGRNSEAFK